MVPVVTSIVITIVPSYITSVPREVGAPWAPWGPAVVTALEFSRKIPDFSWKNGQQPGFLTNLANVHQKTLIKKLRSEFSGLPERSATQSNPRNWGSWSKTNFLDHYSPTAVPFWVYRGSVSVEQRQCLCGTETRPWPGHGHGPGHGPGPRPGHGYFLCITIRYSLCIIFQYSICITITYSICIIIQYSICIIIRYSICIIIRYSLCGIIRYSLWSRA